ncbi:DMT family transporter [Breoghania corrubedonensis]|nr:DMT family transporter [Breoghania corrubedonensis]
MTIAKGVACALVTVTIWAQWIVSTRYAAAVHLPLGWLGLIRYGVPALVLAPFWLRGGLLPKGVDRRLLIVMVAGCGAPFFAVVSNALQKAPAASAGVLLMGVLPLATAILSRLILKETFGAVRLAGFGLSLVAVALIGLAIDLSVAGGALLLLPLGAMLWAGYTLAFRRSGLTPVHATGLISVWSALLFVPLVVFDGFAPLTAIDPGALGWQMVAQGVLSGLVALVTYGIAVRRLGSSNTAAFGALAPALAALMAIPALGEMPDLATSVGVALAVMGVLLASGVVGFGWIGRKVAWAIGGRAT